MTAQNRPRRVDLDLGDGHTLRFHQWSPDRDLNPQYDGIPDVERFGAVIGHYRPDDGTYCEGSITFDSPVARQLIPERALWQVQSWDPLTVSPSLLCKMPKFGADGSIPGTECGDHGFIREGRWVRA